MKCPYCAIDIPSNSPACPYCGGVVNPSSAGEPALAPVSTPTSKRQKSLPTQHQRARDRHPAASEPLKSEGNNSGQGKASVLPLSLRGFNSGAFLWSWVWCLAYRLWLPFFLCLVPGVNIMTWFVLGIKGNQLAWGSWRWESAERFAAIQRRWSEFGMLAILAYFVIGWGGFTLWSSRSSGYSPESPKPVVNQSAAKAQSPVADHIKVLWQLGADAKRRGDFQVARVAWTEILRLDPGHAGIQEAIRKLPGDKPLTQPTAETPELGNAQANSGTPDQDSDKKSESDLFLDAITRLDDNNDDQVDSAYAEEDDPDTGIVRVTREFESYLPERRLGFVEKFYVLWIRVHSPDGSKPAHLKVLNMDDQLVGGSDDKNRPWVTR